MLSGHCDPGFEPLARAFQDVLGHEPFGGGGLCVYQHGRPVFDMWGGPRDKQGHAWERSTPSVSFSTTKGVVATALHMLADRGQVAYDDPVARYWPEFAQRGKGAITVRQVLTHSSGLYDVRNLVEHANVLLDWDKTCDALARAPAAHEPGRYHAYHALTYGHLVGEVIRRVSGKSVSQFVQEEIAQPLGLQDFFIGAPEDAVARAARLIFKERPAVARPRREGGKREPSPRHRRMLAVQRVLRLFGVPMDLERVNLAFAPHGINRFDFSAPEVLRASIPAVNGLFTARDLAHFYAVLAAGGSLDGVRLLSSETLRQATRVHRRGPDGVLVLPMGWRLGYHSVASRTGVVKNAFGHYGYGGSGAWASPEDGTSFGFVVNAGAGTPVGDFRIVKLTSVALACVRAQTARKRKSG